MKNKITFNMVAQVCLVFFTVLGFLLTSLKLPEWGLFANLVSQGFWLYSTYRAWKEADQVGMFINAIIITIIILGGIINYWFLP